MSLQITSSTGARITFLAANKSSDTIVGASVTCRPLYAINPEYTIALGTMGPGDKVYGEVKDYYAQLSFASVYLVGGKIERSP